MIVKILSSSATFNGVKYNTDKIDNGKGELLNIANFGALEGLSNWRPQDFKNYLKAISSQNKLVTKPQFHAVISVKGREMNKEALLAAAEKWLEAMGYGKQPYLVIFHNDTNNNHVHIVTTRIDWNGRKINDSYEKLRGVKAIRNIMRQNDQAKIDAALKYRFTTMAQLRSILEAKGYPELFNAINPDTVKFNEPSKSRAAQLKATLKKYAPRYSSNQLIDFLRKKMGVELLFHSKDGKPAYGYTILDHSQKNAYKGSEVMPLKELLNANERQPQMLPVSKPGQRVAGFGATEHDEPMRINIARDVDDEASHGRRRRKKTRANGR